MCVLKLLGDIEYCIYRVIEFGIIDGASVSNILILHEKEKPFRENTALVSILINLIVNRFYYSESLFI